MTVTPGPGPADRSVLAAGALAMAPRLEIANERVAATVLLPDADRGFYRGTRFDWSGMIASLRCGGQEFYGLWFDRISAEVGDFVFQDEGIVAGPNTAALGPAEGFDPGEPLGWAQAAAGGAFLKIGVGLLRKPADGAPYNSFRTYEFVEPGAWQVVPQPDSVLFIHTVEDAAGGLGCEYRKELRLLPGEPRLQITHRLRNTGSRPFSTTTFNHNFLTLGGDPTALGARAGAAFPLGAPTSIGGPIRLDGATAIFERALAPGEIAKAIFELGHGGAAYDIHVMNREGAGFRAQSDTPLSRLVLWSIHRTLSLEPFVEISVPAGDVRTWTTLYTYSAGSSAIGFSS